jgi:hypothetical protein
VAPEDGAGQVLGDLREDGGRGEGVRQRHGGRVDREHHLAERINVAAE